MFRRIIASIIVVCFTTISVVPHTYAQSFNVMNLPIPGTMVHQTPAYVPVLLKGMTINPSNPLAFDFIVDSGNSDLDVDGLKDETQKLVKYFLAAMTVPQNDLWVNLSPYEKDRIIPDELSKTELGRDLLAQDYILKQLTASMMYPEDELGQKFWKRVERIAKDKYGIDKVPTDLFNKVWILPESASVYEYENTVYVVNSRLKVMTDADYLALSKSRDKESDSRDFQVSNDVLREIIIPEIEHEVNTGANFAPLRQIYHSLILAKWYKQNIKDSLLSKIYTDQNKVEGIVGSGEEEKLAIYDQYMAAYRKGVFSFIKEDYDALSQTIIPKKYFSGGFHDASIVMAPTQNETLARRAQVGNQYRTHVEFDPIEREASKLRVTRRRHMWAVWGTAMVLTGVGLVVSRFHDTDEFVDELNQSKEPINVNILENPVITSAQNGNLELLRFFVNNGSDIHVTDERGFTPFAHSVMNGYTNVAQFLIDEGADVNVVVEFNLTPLLIAVNNEDKAMVELLLKNGADVNYTTPDGTTAVGLAEAFGSVEIAELLKEYIGDTRETDQSGLMPGETIRFVDDGQSGLIDQEGFWVFHGNEPDRPASDFEIKMYFGTDFSFTPSNYRGDTEFGEENLFESDGSAMGLHERIFKIRREIQELNDSLQKEPEMITVFTGDSGKTHNRVSVRRPNPERQKFIEAIKKKERTLINLRRQLPSVEYNGVNRTPQLIDEVAETDASGLGQVESRSVRKYTVDGMMGYLSSNNPEFVRAAMWELLRFKSNFKRISRLNESQSTEIEKNTLNQDQVAQALDKVIKAFELRFPGISKGAYYANDKEAKMTISQALQRVRYTEVLPRDEVKEIRKTLKGQTTWDLIGQLQSEDWGVRTAAAKELGKKRNYEAVQPLMEYLIRRSRVSYGAYEEIVAGVESLVKIGDSRARPAILNAVDRLPSFVSTGYRPKGDAIDGYNFVYHYDLKDFMLKQLYNLTGRASLDKIQTDASALNNMIEELEKELEQINYVLDTFPKEVPQTHPRDGTKLLMRENPVYRSARARKDQVLNKLTLLRMQKETDQSGLLPMGLSGARRVLENPGKHTEEKINQAIAVLRQRANSPIDYPLIQRGEGELQRRSAKEADGSAVGGIDLNRIDIERDGSGITIQFDDNALDSLLDADIQGFTPVIINFVPISSVLPLLGLAPRDEEDEYEITAVEPSYI